jgi:hypothetical protein
VPTAARRERGEGADAAARVRAPPESPLGSDVGAERENCFIILHFIFQDIILFSNMLLTIVTLKAIFIGPQRAMNMCCSLPKHMCISAYIYIWPSSAGTVEKRQQEPSQTNNEGKKLK